MGKQWWYVITFLAVRSPDLVSIVDDIVRSAVLPCKTGCSDIRNLCLAKPNSWKLDIGSDPVRMREISQCLAFRPEYA